VSLLQLYQLNGNKLPLAQYVRQQLPQRLQYTLGLLKDSAYTHATLSILPNQHAPRMERLLASVTTSLAQLELLPETLVDAADVQTLSLLMHELHKQQHELLAFVCRGLAIPHVQPSMLQDGLADKELKTLAKELFVTEQARQWFINEFYNASLGTNVLVNEWLASTNQVRGVEHVSIAQAVQRVTNHVKETSVQYGSMVPQVHIKVNGDADAKVIHSPAYLNGMLNVILDRAIVGTIKHHVSSGDAEAGKRIAPVHVVIVPGESDVSLRISDGSGGMSARKAEQLWMWSSRKVSNGAGECPRRAQDEFIGSTPHHGWPAARLTARYFGGDLNVVPVDGVGMDTFVHLWQQHERPDIMEAINDYVEEVEVREAQWKEWRGDVRELLQQLQASAVV
jgi:hemoglobin-like flavoprotein